MRAGLARGNLPCSSGINGTATLFLTEAYNADEESAPRIFIGQSPGGSEGTKEPAGFIINRAISLEASREGRGPLNFSDERDFRGRCTL